MEFLNYIKKEENLKDENDLLNITYDQLRKYISIGRYINI